MAHNASKEITVNTQAPSTASGAVAWQEAIDELEFRRSQAEALGGTDAVARHHDAGRLSIRERINGLVDSGSFQEIGKLTGQGRYDGARLVSVTPAPYVMGLAQIDGRPRSEEHTSELQSLMRISYAVFCLTKKNINKQAQK